MVTTMVLVMMKMTMIKKMILMITKFAQMNYKLLTSMPLDALGDVIGGCVLLIALITGLLSGTGGGGSFDWIRL